MSLESQTGIDLHNSYAEHMPQGFILAYHLPTKVAQLKSISINPNQSHGQAQYYGHLTPHFGLKICKIFKIFPNRRLDMY